MDIASIQTVLAGLPIPEVRFFSRIESTNATAAEWAREGAPDLALVIAEEQTHGRGRAGRRWFTPAGEALAFSLVLRQFGVNKELRRIARLTALGSMAVCDALAQDYHLPAHIKWPNDVLIRGRKVAGVLAEAAWQGDQLQAVILGIGVNVSPKSLPAPEELAYPATSVEIEAGQRVYRLSLLRSILSALIEQRSRVDTDEYLNEWQERLAFRGEWVHLLWDGGTIEGRLIGLNSDGALKLLTKAGEEKQFLYGDVHLRPLQEDNP